MPLPPNGTDWPPPELAPIAASQAEHDAWWVGSPERLTAVYQGHQGHRPRTRPSQYVGGVVGTVARWLWGTPTNDSDEPRIRLHVPLAADICQASADLLFADPPEITSGDEATQYQLGAYLEDGLPHLLSEAAEIGAALGGTYLRATWDAELQGRSFLTAVDADAAYPEFRYGRLSAVTFWWVLHQDGTTVWRHLERHETIGGRGVVEHGLYIGTGSSLGRRVPLQDRPETAGLAVDADSRIDTGSDGLAVAYVPNVTPQRALRSHAIGRNLGRSDLEGVEPNLDALDWTYSLWMRDLDLAKARIAVPEYMLQTNKPGAGQTFDQDRAVYVTGSAPSSNQGLEYFQFTVDVDNYLTTAKTHIADILRGSGYSAQTFGEDDSGSSATATEIMSRDRRSNMTRDRKIRLFKPAIRQIVAKMLATDRAKFGAAVDPADLAVTFSDSAQDTPRQLAQTAQAMANAQAASIETRVRLLHPDWTDPEIMAERDKIVAESGIMDLADPLTLGVPGDLVDDGGEDDVTREERRDRQ